MKVITDQLFSAANAQHYTLLIELRPQRFSFTVYDEERGCFVAFASCAASETTENYYKDLQAFFKNDFFSTTFSQVRVLWTSQKATLVPAALFTQSAVRSWFDFNFQLLDTEELNYNHIRYNESYSVFSLPSDISSLAINRFKSVRFYHQSTVLIESILRSQKNKPEKKKLFVNVEENFFDVVVINGDKLLLYNNFFFSNAADFVYFLLYVYENLQLNPLEHETTLLGKIDLQSDLLQNLRKYIKKLNFVSFRDEQALFSHIFANIQTAQHANLFNLERCE